MRRRQRLRDRGIRRVFQVDSMEISQVDVTRALTFAAPNRTFRFA